MAPPAPAPWPPAWRLSQLARSVATGNFLTAAAAAAAPQPLAAPPLRRGSLRRGRVWCAPSHPQNLTMVNAVADASHPAAGESAPRHCCPRDKAQGHQEGCRRQVEEAVKAPDPFSPGSRGNVSELAVTYMAEPAAAAAASAAAVTAAVAAAAAAAVAATATAAARLKLLSLTLSLTLPLPSFLSLFPSLSTLSLSFSLSPCQCSPICTVCTVWHAGAHY